MAKADFTYQDFIFYKNVPRETFSRLESYIELLKKWQKTINLIGEATIPQVWTRHIIDSTQLIDHIMPDDPVVDVGSGAGFPGIVLAILGIKNMTLVEKDSRKAAFLQEAARVTKISGINIINQRIEEVSLDDFSVITARAFAPVRELLDILGNELKMHHNLLLFKGKNYMSELEIARKAWAFECRSFPSVTDKASAILSLTNCRKQGGPA